MNPRILKPNNDNRYYINRNDGGFNGAVGNLKKQNPFLTSLPNCVAIYGWFNEIGGKGAVYLKKPWYPYAVIAAARREGLEITQEPTVGGIMVWTEENGDGHVAGCAQIYEDGSLPRNLNTTAQNGSIITEPVETGTGLMAVIGWGEHIFMQGV